MQKPSITFINRVYPPQRGATGRLLRDISRQFVRDGWQVTVLTTGPEAIKERDGAIKVVRVKGPEKPKSAISYSFVWLKLIYASLRLQKTDIVITMTDPPLLVVLGRLWAWLKKSKHIHWCQDVYPDLLPTLNVKLPAFVFNNLKSMHDNSLRSTDKVIAIGRCMANILNEKGMSASKISVIPNWPDAEVVNSRKKVNERIQRVKRHVDQRPENGVKNYDALVKNDPKFRVLYAGNIGKAHPVDAIIEAAESINKTHPEIEFVFVGDGYGFDYLRKAREKKGLENIKFLPYQPRAKLKETLESGDVHLISMTSDALGLLVPSKLYGALAVGRPCILIGPEGSETAQVIGDFSAGAIVAPDDANALIEKIVQYRMDGDTWFAAHEGAAKAGQVFVPKESMNAFIERAQAILDKGSDNE